MIEPPSITQTAVQLAAIIRVAVPPQDLPKVMGPGIEEVRAALARQGIPAMGAWFSHYFKLDPTLFEFEIGVPVAKAVTPDGRVKPGQLPAAKVARTTYHGPYEGLHLAWAEFSSWIKSQGVTPASDLWECYLAGPESGPDATKWRTELNRPLK